MIDYKTWPRRGREERTVKVNYWGRPVPENRDEQLRGTGVKGDMGEPVMAVLFGLNRTGKHIYGGTVSAAEKNRRRAKNRVARKSRKANR